jgi:hypothetical protein
VDGGDDDGVAAGGAVSPSLDTNVLFLLSLTVLFNFSILVI